MHPAFNAVHLQNIGYDHPDYQPVVCAAHNIQMRLKRICCAGSPLRLWCQGRYPVPPGGAALLPRANRGHLTVIKTQIACKIY
jgi:hypothetical protein